MGGRGNDAHGSPAGDLGYGADAGSAYVFIRSGSTWSEQAKLEASDATTTDRFGYSVSIDGDTVVVGAYRDDTTGGTDAGSAYVFTRSGVTWSQQAKLEASDAAADDQFGQFVAVSGDTAVVGAYLGDIGTTTDAGSAYVFTRSGSTWSQQQKLQASDAGTGDQLGWYVAVDGDTAVIGSRRDDTAAGSDAGSAYVFTRSGSTWSQQQKLEAGDAAADAQFGYSVAVDGDTAVVGAAVADTTAGANTGSAYVFTRSGSTWTQQAKLVAADAVGGGEGFGWSAAIVGDIAVIGSASDDTAAGTNAGSAFVFTRSGSTWSQRAKLEASDAAAQDFFGVVVDVEGGTAVVGAYQHDTAAGSNAGSAYAFTLGSFAVPNEPLAVGDSVDLDIPGVDALTVSESTQATTSKAVADGLTLNESITLDLPFSDALTLSDSVIMVLPRWAQMDRLDASDAVDGDQLGYSVAIDGNTAVAGARYADTAAGTDAGSAYVFVRSGSVWTQQGKLEADDAAAGDQFGFSVAVSGDTVIVGAWQGDSTTSTNSGAAYVFTRSGSTWTQQAKLVASNAAAGDQFGYSVSIDGDTAIVGAPIGDTAVTNSGAAYVFTRSGSTWSQQARLEHPTPAGSDQFGSAVDVESDTAVVGARLDDPPAATNAGAAYVFTRSGSTWSLQDTLEASDGAASDDFGGYAAISGDTVVIGARLDDTAGGSGAGSAYVFTRSGSVWSEQAKLEASDAATDNRFGRGVDVDGDTAVIAAFGNDASLNNAGSAYIFTRSESTWSEQVILEADDAATNDQFGWHAAISGVNVVVGARLDDTTVATDAGSAYFFKGVSEPSDSLTLTESIQATTTKAAADSLGVSDSAEATISKGTTDALTLGDSVTLGFSLSDTLAIGDSTPATASKAAADALTIGDSVSLGLSPADILSVADSTSLVHGLPPSDSLVLGDTVTLGLSPTDALAVSDATQAATSKAVADGLAITDTVTLGLSPTDALAVGDSTQAITSKAVAGGLAIADTVTLGLAPSDTLATGDSTGLGHGVPSSDSLVLGDSVTLGLSSSDALALTDAATLGLSPNDALTLSDSVIMVLPRWAQMDRLDASDGGTDDQLGWYVEIDGDTAVVGAYLDDTAGGADAGSVYVFVRSGSVWSQQAKLEASDAAAGDQFGVSVAVSGDTVIVGALFGDSTTSTDSGTAYVFTRSGSVWTQQAELAASNAASNGQFGWSVAIDGDTAIVGARLGDTAVADSGAAYVFTRSGSTWTQQARLDHPSPAGFDHFGSAVDVESDTAVVGARLDDPAAGNNAGAAYVFTRSGSIWTLQDTLEASDGAADDNFGESAALSGDTAIVGTMLDDTAGGTNAGSAYVFTRSGSVWTQQAKLEASDAAADNRFAYTLDLDGDTAVIGAFGNDASLNNAGSAYIFTRSGVTWSQQVLLEAGDAALNDQFGWSVAISGVNVVVGARLDDTTVATDAGSAYFFKGVSEPSVSLTLADSIQATTTKAAADSLGLTDSVTLGLSPSDALTVADSTSLGHGLPSSDSLALADSVALALGVSDTLAVADSTQANTAKPVADAFALADSVALGLGVSDALTVADSTQRTWPSHPPTILWPSRTQSSSSSHDGPRWASSRPTTAAPATSLATPWLSTATPPSPAPSSAIPPQAPTPAPPTSSPAPGPCGPSRPSWKHPTRSPSTSSDGLSPSTATQSSSAHGRPTPPPAPKQVPPTSSLDLGARGPSRPSSRRPMQPPATGSDGPSQSTAIPPSSEPLSATPR